MITGLVLVGLGGLVWSRGVFSFGLGSMLLGLAMIAAGLAVFIVDLVGAP